ncbi:MAG TPA: CHASE3 domain-containing protein [Terriglobales bacterium]|nr:CHASE3 domain-containing protein [Terriglobales bacterium]
MFRPLLTRAISTPFIAMALLIVALSWQVDRLVRVNRWVDHTDQVIAAAHRTEELLVDRETGFRGFLLTGNQLFLEPFYIANRNTPESFQNLEQLVGDDTAQVKRVESMHSSAVLLRSRMEELMKSPENHATAMDFVRSGQSKVMMDDIRGQFREFISVEEAIRQERWRAAQSSLHWSIGLGCGLALLIGVLLSAFSRQTLNALAASYKDALDTAYSKTLALEEASEKLSTTLRSIGDAVIATDNRGYITFLNPVAEQLTGWRSADAAGHLAKDVFRIFHEQSGEPVESPVEKVLTTGTVAILANHTVLHARDGRKIPIDDSGAPIRDAKGKIIGAVLVFRDVTARRQADAEKDRIRRQFELILQSTGDGVYGVDNLGRLTFINKAGAELLGYEPAELIGGLQHQVIHYKHADGTPFPIEECKVHQSSHSGTGYRIDSEVFWKKDGTPIRVEYFSQPIVEDGKIHGAVVSFVDISARLKAQQALLESEKLAATARMISDMAHEVNNPLEALTNIVYLWQTDSAGDPHQQQLARMAAEQLARVTHIVEQTIVLNRAGGPEAPAPLNEIADNVLRSFEDAIQQKHLAVVRDYRFEGLAAIRPADMRQVLANLILNAIQALPDSGTLQVRIAGAHDWKEGRRGVRVSVADNGPGFSAADQKRLFEPFFTTKGNGNGMGLWVARSILEQHGGAIRARSYHAANSHWTCFSVFLELPTERTFSAAAD